MDSPHSHAPPHRKSCIRPFFLYNCALWTVTPTQEKAIDAFQRRQLRYAIGITYPKIITNEQLYRRTKQRKWSKIIKDRRIRLLGHICRMHEDTPTYQSLKEAIRYCKRKQGRPKLTWLGMIKHDLNEINITPDDNFENIIELANNRKVWNTLIKQFAERRDSVGVSTRDSTVQK